MHVSQPHVASVVAIRQLRVVHPKQVEHGRVQVVWRDPLLGGLVAEVVAGPGFLSTINYLIPGVAFLVGITVLSEPPAWPQFVALFLILGGVWLIQPRQAASGGEQTLAHRRRA